MRWLTISIIVLVAACGGVSAVDEFSRATSTTLATTTTSTTLATTTTTRAPTTTTAIAEQPLVLVALGDSFVSWSSWPQLYGDLAAESLDREVVVDKSLARPGQGPRLPVIKDDPDAHALIRSADIIVVQPEPGFIARFATQYLAGECGESNQCFREAADEYRVFLEEYVNLVLEHADPESAIRLVTTGTWGIDAFYGSTRENDPEAHADLVGVVVLIMEELKAVAAERGIPVADVNAAFNGDDYLQLAPDEYLVADGMHLADAGSEVVAALLNDLGYNDLGK
jgi:hypothetical protein